MSLDKPTGYFGHAPVPFAGEPIADFRARLVRQQAEIAERRRLDLVEQASVLNTPEARIRIWERLHGISLPRDPAHRLIGIVASGTGLTLDEVRAEQRHRSEPATAAVAPVAADGA
jgi:hypothetical protein